jgi:hypothetical protein
MTVERILRVSTRKDLDSLDHLAGQNFREGFGCELAFCAFRNNAPPSY